MYSLTLKNCFEIKTCAIETIVNIFIKIMERVINLFPSTIIDYLEDRSSK